MTHAETAEAPLAPQRMPQLDGLRAAGCLAVMFSHFVIPQAAWWPAFLPLGGMGVQLFFVLSGFLITGILLDRRAAVESGACGAGAALKNFYLRRCLRIMPLYYLILLVLAGMDYGIMRETWPWHALLVMNFWRAATGVTFLNHFWAVAVEMQFYLCWPLLILFLPRRRIVPVLLFLMLLAPCYRGWCWYSGAGFAAANTLPPASLDTLGMGALLAVFMREPGWYARLRPLFLRFGPLLGAAGLALWMALDGLFAFSPELRWIPLNSLLALLWGGVVMGAAAGFSGPAGVLLNASPVRWLGRVSYGVYLLHPLVAGAVLYAHERLGTPWPDNLAARFLLLVALSLAAAAFSWHLVEQPMQWLKRFFPDRP